MRHKELKLSYLLLLGFGLTGLQAQKINIKEKSDSAISYTLSEIKKMSFSEGRILISKTDENTISYVLSNIQRLDFTNDVTNVPLFSKQDAKIRYILFPNPTNDVLNIQCTVSENQLIKLEIFSIEGKILYSKVLEKSTKTNQIDVSALTKGLYLLRLLGNKESITIKFQKN